MIIVPASSLHMIDLWVTEAFFSLPTLRTPWHLSIGCLETGERGAVSSRQSTCDQWQQGACLLGKWHNLVVKILLVHLPVSQSQGQFVAVHEYRTDFFFP